MLHLPPSDIVVEVKDLHVTFELPNRTVYAVNGADFVVRQGETLGIVGESGSGKSVAAQSIPRLVNASTARSSGSIMLQHGGAKLNTLAERSHGRVMRQVRSESVAVIFQEPMRSLHPMFTIGWQITEGLRYARRVDREAAKKRAIELLKLVGLPEPESNFTRFPHQLSGGMRQRVMIAIALAANPRLLIADEPTTALDVTIQAQILELLKTVQRELGMAVLLITHDLGVVAETADRVAAMYLGQIVETGPVRDVFAAPRHPYTQGLLATTPRLDSVPKSNLPTLKGNIPELSAAPTSCVFVDRCPHARAICQKRPPITRMGEIETRCWIYTPEWNQQ